MGWNTLFYHECMRRAMSTLEPVGPLINVCRSGPEVAEHALRGKIGWKAIMAYDQVRNFKLDSGQANVCKTINKSRP